MTSPAVTQDTEVDLKDVELNEMDLEKQPMTASSPLAGSPGSLGEKNGVVKVKVAEDEEEEGAMAAKFTGLSKEELLQVAGTPGWVRTRWALLILFWLGWLGMLAGAIVIIVHAPRCKELPQQEWWQKGGMYRIQDVEKFQDSDEDGKGDLAGLKQRMDYISSLKVKGLVIGPLHVNLDDSQSGTNLQAIDPRFGNLEQFQEVLQAAKKKSLKVVLDLTPNYRGKSPWFSPQILASNSFRDEMKAAIEFWLKKGVSGIQISNIEELHDTQILDDWKNVTSLYSVDDQARVLIAVTNKQDTQGFFSLLNETKAVDLLTSQYLLGLTKEPQKDTPANMIDHYIKAFEDGWPGWNVGGFNGKQLNEQLLRLYHMLLYTLPGTPFTDYGDEIGLWELSRQPAASSVIRMQWDDTANYGFSKKPQQSDQRVGNSSNYTVQSQSDNKASILTLFQQLSELRGKERSLLHGEFLLAKSNDTQVLAYLRIWDQNQRFLVVLNFASANRTVSITASQVPPEVEVAVEHSTDPLRVKESLNLKTLHLRPLEGLLFSFPYVA